MRGAAAAALVVVAACSGGGGDDDYTVLAAASLTDAFERIADDVCCGTISFGPSSAIVGHVTEGASADVVATADEATMDAVAATGLLDGEPILVARNSVVLVVPSGNPAGLTSVADLGDRGVLAVCAADVPCGRAAAQWLDHVDAAIEPTTFESDVKAVLAKVELGEVDAGIVYRTDAESADDDVDVVDRAADVANDYFVALLDGAPDRARAFVDAVTGERGRRVLSDLGFTVP